MIRFFDILISLLGMLVIWPLLLLIAFICFLDTGSPIFIQLRVGRRQVPFKLIKFRTMHVGTADVPTHLVEKSAITPVGYLLRRTRMDELLQLWNVLNGDMSLVGPRPCLQSQVELISEREFFGIYKVRPGLTGLAQISDVDMSDPQKLVALEVKMMNQMSIVNYFKYIFSTILGVMGLIDNSEDKRSNG